ASAPRSGGADGRPLLRPGREPAERAAAEAGRVRAARRQAAWPKLLGWGCIGVACIAAVAPVTPSPWHVEVSAERGPAHEPRRPAMAIASLGFDEQLGAFRWDEPGPATAAARRFVLLGEDYAQLAVVDGIGPSPWRPTAAQTEGWRRGVPLHGFVLSVVNDRTVKSPMIRFVWR
ncbi:MAG: hypothetical protein ACON4Z_09925, partial [Planctomycetota bacterium]